MSVTLAGSRLARRAAASIRERTVRRLAAIAWESVTELGEGPAATRCASRTFGYYFLIWERTALACSAYWPVGASFRYSSNSFAASAMFAWFRFAIASQ